MQPDDMVVLIRQLTRLFWKSKQRIVSLSPGCDIFALSETPKKVNCEPEKQKAPQGRFLKLLDQHHVGGVFALGQQQLFAVASRKNRRSVRK
jgi:hypothetical protein